jgi:hypothetical protein
MSNKGLRKLTCLYCTSLTRHVQIGDGDMYLHLHLWVSRNAIDCQKSSF